jgi:hyperosmotically inducible protein
MNTHAKLVMLILSSTLTISLSGCEKQGPAEKAGKSIDSAIEQSGDKIQSTSDALDRQTEKASIALDDTAITAKVKEAIFVEPELEVLKISVNTTNGVTTLTGSVDTPQNSIRAEEIASKVNGVKSVKNQLVIK